MRDILLGALRLSLVTLVLCGLAYPLAVTAIGQWLLPWQLQSPRMLLLQSLLVLMLP